MRDCPVCTGEKRELVFSMDYQIPDLWPLPDRINWYKCDTCGMLYGDGEFSQSMLNEYYTKYYGYGLNNPMNIDRLNRDAVMLEEHAQDSVIVDFGGAGDDGRSIIVDHLTSKGFTGAVCVNAGDALPLNCDVIYASHVIEHIYDLPDMMMKFVNALCPNGVLITDIPDAYGLLDRWQMPILDFNTKHINHFTLRNMLDLGYHHGLEAVHLHDYEMENAHAYQIHFKRFDVARRSMRHVTACVLYRLDKLNALDEPVNIWGMSDIAWHLLSQSVVNVLDYVDNDPAMRGQTYKGRPILERPTNDAPIVILAQGQRGRLIENIRAMGILNRIIEI